MIYAAVIKWCSCRGQFKNDANNQKGVKKSCGVSGQLGELTIVVKKELHWRDPGHTPRWSWQAGSGWKPAGLGDPEETGLLPFYVSQQWQHLFC